MEMSSEEFENMDDEVRSLLDDIQRRINVLIPRHVGEERKKAIREAERLFDDANQLLSEMEFEIPKAPLPLRQQMNTKVRGYRDQLKKMASELKQLKDSTQANFTSQELFAGEGGLTSHDIISGQRSRLLQGNQILDRTSQSIARSHRVAIETEDIGHEIMSEMGDQRESLLRTQATIHGTDANLMQSRKILKSMYMRVMTNKLILGVVIILEVFILVFVVYWKFFR